MGQFSNSFPKQFSYLCEYAVRFDLSCSFCEYPFIFQCLHCSPSCFDPDSPLLPHLWLVLSLIDCISANKSFSSSKTSSRKPYTSSKQQERQKHSVETTINLSCTHTSYAYDNWQLRGSHGFNLRRLPSSPSGQNSHSRLTILAISTMSRHSYSSSGQNSPSRLTLLAISTMSRRNPHTLHPQRSPRLELCTSG